MLGARLQPHSWNKAMVLHHTIVDREERRKGNNKKKKKEWGGNTKVLMMMVFKFNVFIPVDFLPDVTGSLSRLLALPRL